MRRRLRLLRATCVILTLCVGVLMIASEFVEITWLDVRSGSLHYAKLGRQHVFVLVVGGWTLREFLPPSGTMSLDSAESPGSRRWVPLWNPVGSNLDITIPLWMLAIIPASLTAYFYFRHRPNPTLCPTCNYSLAGIPSNICPECGTPHAAKQS